MHSKYHLVSPVSISWDNIYSILHLMSTNGQKKRPLSGLFKVNTDSFYQKVNPTEKR